MLNEYNWIGFLGYLSVFLLFFLGTLNTVLFIIPRIIKLGKNDGWKFKLPPSDILASTPAYSLLLHVTLLVVGTYISQKIFFNMLLPYWDLMIKNQYFNDIAILIGLFFGMLTLVIGYLIVKRFVKNTKLSLLLALMMAIGVYVFTKPIIYTSYENKYGIDDNKWLKILAKAVDKQNKTLPKILKDNETSMDTVYLKNKTLFYKYTVLDENTTVEDIKKRKDFIYKQLCKSKNYRISLNHGIEIIQEFTMSNRKDKVELHFTSCP